MQNSEPVETTIFVTTIGDEKNFTDCMEHLAAQTVSRPIEVIDRVAPMSAAFSEMHRRCSAPFYVQVDEDMILFPHAIATLEQRIRSGPESLAMVCAPLWDCDTSQPLYGVKIYRHEIVKQFPYQSALASESIQLKQIRSAGFTIDLLPLTQEACLGEHGKHYSPATIFVRWQRLLQKQILYRNRDWVAAWPKRLLDRYVETQDPVHLYAVLGSIAGITGAPLPDAELDFTKPNEALERVRAYFPFES